MPPLYPPPNKPPVDFIGAGVPPHPPRLEERRLRLVFLRLVFWEYLRPPLLLHEYLVRLHGARYFFERVLDFLSDFFLAIYNIY